MTRISLTKGGSREGARKPRGAQLEEGAACEDAAQALDERERRVARRGAAVDREQQDCELEARLNAWQRSMERREEGEAQEEGETESTRQLLR